MKMIFGIIAVFLSFAAYAPYIRQTIKKQIKPHPFTWFVSGISLGTNGLLILLNGGGISGTLSDFTWVLASFLLAGFSIRNFKRDEISRLDIISLIAAILVYIIWLFIGSPLAATILLTVVDVTALSITVRKTWRDPSSESPRFWTTCLLLDLFIAAALEEYNAITLTNLIAWAVMNALVIIVIFYRRSTIKKRLPPKRQRGVNVNVFVYGTLKRGFGNNHVLVDSQYIGKGFVEKYRLYHANASFPGIVESRNKQDITYGEVFRIKDKCIIKALDDLEQEGTMYRRVRTDVKLEDGSNIKAYVYVWLSKIDSSTPEVKGNNWTGPYTVTEKK